MEGEPCYSETFFHPYWVHSVLLYCVALLEQEAAQPHMACHENQRRKHLKIQVKNKLKFQHNN